jgi:hypothetical protein
VGRVHLLVSTERMGVRARDLALSQHSSERRRAASENKLIPSPDLQILPHNSILQNIVQAYEVYCGKAKTHRLQYSIIHDDKDLCWDAGDSLDESNQ